jgi:hypothetical protein
MNQVQFIKSIEKDLVLPPVGIFSWIDTNHGQLILHDDALLYVMDTRMDGTRQGLRIFYTTE